MVAPVSTQEKFEPRPSPFVPVFSRASSSLVSLPLCTSNRQPSGAETSITGSTQALLFAILDTKKDETSGTMAPFAAGSGERTVRAQSQAITVASEPLGNFALG